MLAGTPASVELTARVRLVPRQHSRQHDNHYNTTRPHVGEGTLVWDASEQFRRHVGWRATLLLKFASPTLVLVHGRKPKVGQFDITAHVQQDILRLDIAMGNTQRMQVAHRTKQLSHVNDRDSFTLAQADLRNDLVKQLAARSIFKNEKSCIGRLKGLREERVDGAFCIG